YARPRLISISPRLIGSIRFRYAPDRNDPAPAGDSTHIALLAAAGKTIQSQLCPYCRMNDNQPAGVPDDEHDGASTKPAPGSFAELFHAWRYLFLFLGLALGIVLFYAEENWRGRRAWTNYRQEMA